MSARREAFPVRRVFRFQRRDDAGCACLAYVPASAPADAPILVVVHGITRNVEEHARLFADPCETAGVVLVAPHFPPQEFPDYQRLGRVGRGRRADLALEALLAEFAPTVGASTGPVHLFGFSGGAQFAHRFTMAYPQRVASAVFGAPGWYTFPDRREPYPYGLRRTSSRPDLRLDPDRFLRVPMTVIVGDRDISALDLRITERVIRQQGENRLERAQRWVAAMQATAQSFGLPSLVKLETLPGGEHVFAALMQRGGLGERVMAALFGPASARGNGAQIA